MFTTHLLKISRSDFQGYIYSHLQSLEIDTVSHWSYTLHNKRGPGGVSSMHCRNSKVTVDKAQVATYDDEKGWRYSMISS